MENTHLKYIRKGIEIWKTYFIIVIITVIMILTDVIIIILVIGAIQKNRS